MTSIEPAAKRLDNTIKTITTHDGSFHCDEALACYLLQLLPQFKGSDLSCMHFTCDTRQKPRL